MSKSSSSIKKTIKLRIFNILYSLICKSQESSFRQLEYKSFSFRILAYFAGEDLQKKVVWFKAAENGDTKRISQIYDSFENKADIDIMDEQGHTALHIATLYKHIATVEILIRAGANINTQDKNNNIPSKLDLEKKNEAAISLLKEPVDNPNNPDIVSQDKAQTLAEDEHVNAELKESLGSETQVNRSEDLKRLDVDFRIAILKGNFEEAKKLIELGADVNSKTTNNETLLHMAVVTGDLEIVMKLVGFGADILSKDQNGYTVLDIALFREDITMIKNLVELKPELLEMQDEREKTALHLASSEGSLEVVKELLYHATKLKDVKKFLEIKDKHGDTALHMASSKGRMDVVEQLQKSGADLEAKDKLGFTVLHIAAFYGKTLIVSELRKLGANLEAKTDQDNTALHLAVFAGHFETIKELIELGAKLDVENKDNITPLYAARYLKRDDMISLLKKAADREKQLVTKQEPESLTSPSGPPRLGISQPSGKIQQTKT